MKIEDRISLGNVVVRIISPRDPEPLIEHVCRLGYGIARLAGWGRSTSQVSVLLMVVPRKELGELLPVLQKDYPDLLFTVEDVRILHDHGPIYYGKGTKEP